MDVRILTLQSKIVHIMLFAKVRSNCRKINRITSIYVCVLISHRPLSLELFMNHNNLNDIFFFFLLFSFTKRATIWIEKQIYVVG